MVQLTQAEQEAAAKRKQRAIKLVQTLMDRTEDRGFTESEAMDAAAKVGELMAQNELSLTDVSARDVSDMVQRKLYASDKMAVGVVGGVARLCSLKHYHETGQEVTTFVIFGHAPDVELAVFLYEVCMEAAEQGWGADMQRNGYSKAKRDSFRTGFGERVRQRLKDLHAQREADRRARMPVSGSTDLVVVKDQIVLAEFEKLGVKLTMSKAPPVKDAAAYYRGSAHGNTVNLNNPLQDHSKRAAGLLA